MAEVAVLGCGPAGLLAAHAAQLHGHSVTIFTPKIEKSVISGAQYLHSPIHGVTSAIADGMINYVKVGDRGGYAEKVYGHHDAPCSWDLYPASTVPAWSLQRAYAALWRCYRHSMAECAANHDNIQDIARHYFLVLSTAPRHVIQHGDAPTEQAWIKNDTAPQGLPENTIVYNGDPDIWWYRTSNIFGHLSMEWPNTRGPEFVPHLAKRIAKPLSFTPHQDLPGNVRFLGRYGQWKKGVLVDHVFKRATEILESK